MQAGVIGPETVVLTLQNGLGNEEILGEIVGADRVIAGRTYVSGRLLGPGRVMAAVKGCRTIIGELDGRVTERIRRIGREFGRVGLTTVSYTHLGFHRRFGGNRGDGAQMDRRSGIYFPGLL